MKGWAIGGAVLALVVAAGGGCAELFDATGASPKPTAKATVSKSGLAGYWTLAVGRLPSGEIGAVIAKIEDLGSDKLTGALFGASCTTFGKPFGLINGAVTSPKSGLSKVTLYLGVVDSQVATLSGEISEDFINMSGTVPGVWRAKKIEGAIPTPAPSECPPGVTPPPWPGEEPAATPEPTASPSLTPTPATLASPEASPTASPPPAGNSGSIAD